MLKNILLINFIISFCTGLTIYLAQFFGVKLPFLINNYVNDFLIIPIVLSICLCLLRFTRDNNTYLLPIGIILFLCFGYTLFFEIYMPRISERYTRDIYDVLTYFLGGFWFWFLQKKSIQKAEF